MGPRKRPRRDNGEGSSASRPRTPLQPSLATTTSQVSSLSAAKEPPLPSQQSTLRTQTDKGMPPLPIQKFDTFSSRDGINRNNQQGSKLIHKTRSWYGSLSRKSTASTSLQREAIASSPLTAGSTPDFHRYGLKRNGDTASLSGASQASASANSQPQDDAPEAVKADTMNKPSAAMNSESIGGNDAGDSQASDHTTAGNAASNAPPVADIPQRPSTSSGWLGGLFSRTPLSESTATQPHNVSQEQAEVPKETHPEPPAQEPLDTVVEEASDATTAGQRAASYLFYFWPSKTTPDDAKDEGAKETETVPVSASVAEDVPMNDAPPPESEAAVKPSAGSTWAFWSVSRPKTAGDGPKETEAVESGEVAVLGEGSERHPKRTNSMDLGRDTSVKADTPKEQPLKSKTEDKNKPNKKAKKARTQPADLKEIPSRPQTPQSDTASIKAGSPPKSKVKTPTTSTKPSPPNLILPSFKGTYRMKDNPSILKQIAALLLRTKQPATKHVFLATDPPKIKKAIAIGVHGLFPAAFLRAMIGQPTGTSIKFANLCAESIQRWADSHGCGDCVIEKVALEGEGKIETRVANLWNLLQNWMDHIRSADFVVIACHSQGVPVSVMLLERLMASGAITNARVGICAMAGVNLGPFPEYKGSMGMLMGTAAELWEFASSESDVSRRYEKALKSIVSRGARITYVGSIDDQLVPIESAIYSPASHPYIYRAIFIDGRIHAPDFIAHLVGFACKLRNLGISDHGLIRELSVPLAGSLYGGEGHSRLYEDGQVYDLAIAHALETTDVPGDVPCEIQRYDPHGITPSNPYLLPWIMRGLLEEDLVKTELSAETEELLRQFDDWRPVKQALRDVKFRLEAVRSKL